jgi:RNA polymerase sigma factor (sigma-70 family)
MEAQARFDALYREHAGAVTRYVRRRCEPESADDVVADVFVVAWRRLDEMPEDPLPWLLGVARRVLANRRRSDARADALRQRIGSEERARATTRNDDDDGTAAVWAALGTLSDREREALLLVAWEGLSTARAARVAGIGANAFAARLYRARRRFARALGGAAPQAARPQRPSAGKEVLR